MLLDMVDRVVDLNGVKDRRFRVCPDSYFRMISFPCTLLSFFYYYFRTNSLYLVESKLNICISNQIEHAQHLAPGAANRFGKHGIIASVQVNYSVPLLLYIRIMLYKTDCAFKSSASEFLLKIFNF